MPFSFRPDPETEALIRRVAARTGWSKSQVVREAVAQYGRTEAPGAAHGRVDPSTALARLRPYLGIVNTGAQLSRNTHAKYRARLRTKLRERRSR
jgi:hypothetical protein